jgi:hypothetical protein
MKKAIEIFIFCLVLTAASTENVFAQKAPSQNLADEQSVKKFADSFLKSFLNIKNLEKMPPHFFAKAFKSNFRDSNFYFSEEESKEVTAKETFEQNILQFHFQNLMVAIVADSYSGKKDNESEAKSEKPYLQNLPKRIVNLLKKSKIFKSILGETGAKNAIEDMDKLPITKQKQFIKSFKKEQLEIIEAMKKHLNKSPIQYSKQFQASRANFFKYFEAELCKDKKCLGQPENTPIFSVHELMMRLRIARINNELKIIQIYSVAMED